MEMDSLEYSALDEQPALEPSKRRSSKFRPLRKLAATVNPLSWIAKVDFADAGKRIFAFLIVQGLLITAVALLLVVTKQETLVTIPSPKHVILEVENCDILVQRSTLLEVSYIDVSTQQSPNVHVSFNDTADSLIVRVKNDRDLYDRYAGYFCAVTYSPLWRFAPSLTIRALGRRQTLVEIEGINFGNSSLVLETEKSNGLISALIDSSAVGTVRANLSSGFLWMTNVEINGDVLFDALLSSSLWINTTSQVIVDSTAPDNLKCITALNLQCLTSSNGTFNCSSILASSNDEPVRRVVVTNPATSVSVLSLPHETITTPFKTNDGHPTSIGLSSLSQQQASSPFSLTPYPDVVYYSVFGPGSPLGLWSLVHNHVYLFFSEPFLDFSTFRLMSPSSAKMRLPLYPARCPSPDNDLKLSNLEPIYTMFAEGLLAKQITTRSDSFAFIETLDNIAGQVWTLKKDFQSGEYYNYWPEARLIYFAVAVLNALLAIITGLGITYVLVRNFLQWREEQIDLWGTLFYGEDEYAIKKSTILSRADIFFMAEFLVGFPGKTRRFLSSMLLMLVHTMVIILPAVPITVAMILFNNSIARLSRTVPVTTYIGIIVLGCFLIAGCANLITYYLGSCVPRRLRTIISVPFTFFYVLIFCASVTYLIHVAYWLVLGSMLRPDLILPFCSVAVLSVVQLVGTYSRVSNLYDQLRFQEQEEEQEDALEEGEAVASSSQVEQAAAGEKPAASPAPAKPATWAIPALMGAPLPVTGAINVLQDPDLLNFKNVTTREKIAETIVRFLILLLFYGFVLLGFVAFGSTALASGVSTALIVAAGGTFVASLKTTDSKIAESIQRRFKDQILQEADKRKKTK